jgi:hypothetical protein
MKEVITVMVTRDVQNVKCFCNGMESDVLVAAVFLGQSRITPCQREGNLTTKQRNNNYVTYRLVKIIR